MSFAVRRLPLTVLVALALLSAMCSAKAAGPPEIVVDRTVCSHCGMLVSEPIYAAAYQVGGSEPRVFDDIGCLLDAARREATPPDRVWFQNAAGGGWLNTEQAAFVASPRIKTPMSGGVLAYPDVTAAQQAATAHGGEVLRSLPELLTWKGDAR